MNRREIITALGSAAAWPAMARAQQPAMPVIGFLGAQSADDDYKNVTVPLLQSLKESGYVDGQNMSIEYRWAENQYDRLPALAADLPVEQATKIELVINLKTAKALGLTIPETLLATADEVIQ